MNKKTLLILMTTVFLSNINSKPKQNDTIEQKQTITEVTQKEKSTKNISKTKNTDLSCEEMDLFNAILEIKPSAIHQIKKALRIVKNEMEKLKTHKEKDKYNITQQQVIKYRDNILESLKPFIIRVLKYEDIIKKIIEKSLKTDFPNSLLLNFLELKDKQKEKDLYFEKNINTAEELELTCLEFTKLLSDIEHNMSQEAKKTYIDAIEKAKKTKSKH